jgi:hypothetical protein
VVVHHIQLRDSGDNLAVQGQDHITFKESAAFFSALEGTFADHEELVARGVIQGDLLDPFF